MFLYSYVKCLVIKSTKYTIHLLSSSIMVTVASPGSPTVTLYGSDELIIVSVKVSLCSKLISSLIVMLNEAFVILARYVAEYGPES